jgi:hypothetical protein
LSRNESASESLLIDLGNFEPDPPQGQIQITDDFDDLLGLNESSNNNKPSGKGIIYICIFFLKKKKIYYFLTLLYLQ